MKSFDSALPESASVDRTAHRDRLTTLQRESLHQIAACAEPSPPPRSRSEELLFLKVDPRFQSLRRIGLAPIS